MAEPASSPRETQLDRRRRREVSDHVHAAICQRAAVALAAEPGPLLCTAPPRAVLAHRHRWFRQVLSRALEERGIDVLAAVENGAEALGVVVAEQPDLLLSGDRLLMMSGAELVRETSLYAPRTQVVARAEGSAGTSAMHDAGAAVLVPHLRAPEEVADDLLALLLQVEHESVAGPLRASRD